MFLRFIGLSYIYGGEWENTRNFWKFMDLLFARLGVMPSDEAGAQFTVISLLHMIYHKLARF